jgi:hypothetical protein
MTTRKPAAVSMEPVLYERAKARAAELGFVTFSAYVCQLIRSDLHTGGGMLLVRDAPSSEPLPPRQSVEYSTLPNTRTTPP